MPNLRDELRTPRGMLLAQVIVLAILCLPGMLLAHVAQVPLAVPLRWQSMTIPMGLAWALGLILINALSYGPLAHRWAAFRFLTETLEQLLLPVFRDLPLWTSVSLALLAGLGEEYIFRGWMQPALIHWWGIAGGIGVTAFLFAAIHFPPLKDRWPMTAYYLHYGLILGWVAAATPDGLVRAMIAHAVYDLIILLLLPTYEQHYRASPLESPV